STGCSMTTETETLIRPAARVGHKERAGAVLPKVRAVGKHVLMILVSIIMVYPLIWLVVSSFKPNDEIFQNLSIFTTNLTLDNYVDGWNGLQHAFGLFLLNSTIIALGAIIGNLLSCSMAAYAFARLKFRFRTLTFTLMLGS